jgi:hypothetical protein
MLRLLGIFIVVSVSERIGLPLSFSKLEVSLPESSRFVANTCCGIQLKLRTNSLLTDREE